MASPTGELPPYRGISPRPISQDGRYVHRWSGISLPDRTGDFLRKGLVQFDEAGLDVSGEYVWRSAQGMVLATVYVYPIFPSIPANPATSVARCAEEFSSVKAALLIHFPDAEEVDHWRESVPGLSDDFPGRAVAYHLTGDILGPEQALRSEAHLFCTVRGLWAVKYRISYPQALDAAAAVESFMRATPVLPAP